MKFKLFAALYLGIAAGANAQGLAEVELAGDMRKLVVHAAPKDLPAATFEDADGTARDLSEIEGPVLLNFWATWCAPCREEMPSLDAVAVREGAPRVVTVATGRNSVDGIERFFAEEGIENLPVYLDPRQQMARGFAVLGLPVTVLLDAEGREVARLTGDADWAGEDARAVLDALGQ